MATTDTPLWNWAGMDPAEWIRTWQTAWRFGPESLVQPILPGWTLNVNSNNSSSPQTEVDVLARHSYGRQIGRMADALAILIVEQHGQVPKDKSFAEFLSMKHEIDKVKQDAAASRIEQLTRDLALLKDSNETKYTELRDALRKALDEDEVRKPGRGSA